MHAVRQKCRPKHQVLVLNCYPRHHKHNVEVKPNSSELSYLLYYASTRRTKLQKVGDFLEKRTTSDVWKARIGNVQVTLQIIKALIEKTPRDLPLYAGAVLRIFKIILKSNDLTMIEETVPTWEAFCNHQDPAQIAADQDFTTRYDEIVQMYASFASKEDPIQLKTNKSIPTLIRYRKAGLDAIRAIASSDILNTETGNQLATIVPIMLENIYSESGQYLNTLEKRDEEQSELEKEMAIKRRQSISTVRTTDTSGEGDAVAASGTTEAADKIAEQEAAVIALQALKNIFANAPRGQLRFVAQEVLTWVGQRVKPNDHFPSTDRSTLVAGSWPCTLFTLICSWSPVQDRYVILVTAMDTLIRSPIADNDLERQYVYAVIIGWLLGSDINFIGLSVMDVLVGLMQHILLVLQLGGAGTSVLPHAQQADAAEAKDLSEPAGDAGTDGVPLVMVVSKTPTPARLQLLTQLKHCIGALAVHVYYSDQISDMISAILVRLKPSATMQVPDTASAIENPIDTANALASSVNLSEKPGVDGFFSFETARIAALEAVQEIIICANTTKKDGSSNSTARSPLDLDRWDGTQWLLRDPSWKIRAAYVQALLTWLKFELRKKDLRVPEEQSPKKKNSLKNQNGTKDTSLARRAVSNASHRESSPKRKRNTFLQLLHLAIYDNALQYADAEADMLLLHLLLNQLVIKLGVNAVQHGLPMIVRLQEEIPVTDSPKAKINIGSLVHGYFWTLSVYFSFDGASVGRDIHNEISRRANHGIWLSSVRVPPLSLQQIEERLSAHQPDPSTATVESETLKPYDKREALVQKVAEGYSMSLYSPPVSPPGSPSRTYSQPMLGHAARQPSFSAPKPPKDNSLPDRTKDILLSDWTREAVVTAITASDGSKSGSLHGSGSPTTATHSGARHLSVGTAPANGSTTQLDGLPSPRNKHYSQLHSSRPASGAYGYTGSAMRDALHGAGRPRSRKSRRASQNSTPYSTTSSVRSTLRVDDLKRVLGGAQLQQASQTRGDEEKGEDAEADDTGSESMISYEGSDLSFVTAANQNAAIPGVAVTDQAGDVNGDVDAEGNEGQRNDALTEGSITPRPGTAASAAVVGKRQSSDSLKRKPSITSQDNDDVPPVPPIPANLRSPTPSSGYTGGLAPDRMGSVASRKAHSVRSTGSGYRDRSDRPRTAGSFTSRSNRYSTMTTGSKMHWSARDLLDDIDAEAPNAGSRSVGALGGRPPY